MKHDPQWARAKKVCRLNMEDIQMAKELGLSPKSLIKNQPNPSQRWKLPVKHWIRELHAKQFGSRAKTANHPAPPRCPPHPDDRDGVDTANTAIPDEDIPF